MKLRFEDLPKTYSALCAVEPPRVIRSKAQLKRAVKVTDAMAIYGGKFTRDQRDYFDTLCWMIQIHEGNQ